MFGDRHDLKGGDEWDCYTGWRKVLNAPNRGWKFIKQKYKRRCRRKLREEIRRMRGEE